MMAARIPLDDSMIYADMARSAFPNGFRLRCRVCGKIESRRRRNSDDAAYFLQYGWPRCCKETMELEREE